LGHDARESKGPFNGNPSLDIDTRKQDHSRLGRAIPAGAALYARCGACFKKGKVLGLIATAMPTTARAGDIGRIVLTGSTWNFRLFLVVSREK
jgi:hypothetical protein